MLSLPEVVKKCNQGRICFDGVDISSVPSNEEKGDSTEADQASKKALIHEFIETLPQKYNTIFGDDTDIALTVGQLQPIHGSARTLVPSPAPLRTDEAIEALDAIPERVIIDAVVDFVARARRL